MIVVDASVAVKWFLREDYSHEARKVASAGLKMVGPTLVQYETAGAFVRAMRRNDINATDAMQCCQKWLHTLKAQVIRLESDHRDVTAGSRLAAQLQHPLADCIYLAMAERLDASLVTADRPFCERATKHHKPVLFLTDVDQLHESAKR